MQRKEHVGTVEKWLTIHSCSWEKMGTLPPSFSAHLPTAQSVSLTPRRSQICWRSISDCKNQCKAAPVRCLSGRQGQGWVLTCAVSLQSRKPHAGFPGACPSRNPPLKPVAPGWWNEKPLNCFHKWSSKCKYSGWSIGNLFFRLSSKAWEEQHGNGVVVPPLPINKSACVHIHPRERMHSTYLWCWWT